MEIQVLIYKNINIYKYQFINVIDNHHLVLQQSTHPHTTHVTASSPSLFPGRTRFSPAERRFFFLLSFCPIVFPFYGGNCQGARENTRAASLRPGPWAFSPPTPTSAWFSNEMCLVTFQILLAALVSGSYQQRPTV